MLIKVKTLTGKGVGQSTCLCSYNEILRIKERVEEKEGIPPVQQRLIFGGKQMADDKTVKDFGIEGGTVLHVRMHPNVQLVLSLRGG